MSAITIDFRPFDAALTEYIAHSRRDIPTILNGKAGDLAFRAAQFSPTGNRGDIDALKSKTWWPAFLQKILNVSGKFEITRRVKAKGSSAKVYYRDAASGKLKYGRKTMGVKVDVAADRRRKNMKTMSAKIIKRRKATLNSFKGIFGAVALRFGKSSTKFGHKVTPGATIVQPANPMRYAAAFQFAFKNTKSPWPPSKFGRRPSPDEDVRTKQTIAARALQASVNFVVNDMRQHVQSKLAERARQISAKAA